MKRIYERQIADIRRKTDAKILVVGDACNDVYRFGTCKRKNPESPAPLLLVNATEMRGGMALNVANNISSLGMHVDVITNEFKPTKERFFDTLYSYQLLRVDDASRIDRIKSHVLENIAYDEYAAVVISDYDKGFLSIADIAFIANRCSSKKVFVDSKKTSLAAVDFSNVIINLNDTEWQSLEKPIPNKASVIVTLGSLGASYNGKLYPGYTCPVFDVCGAGDTFLAGLAVAFNATDDIGASIDFANKCASLAVRHVGTYIVTVDDIEQSFGI
jgi:bifunctional ADP-heptose synthase (sugar kinase/adenylyltransferase)